ncbi:riboflavin synthase [Halobacteriales archaeon QS_7_69_60]|nr:MAG: riboflavin synthase [Halobacteriales archaeon QS_7_69_60]
MFTGIVEETGEVTFVEDGPEGRRFGVSASFCDELAHGQSVAISGACLTVEGVTTDGGDEFGLFCSEETLERTYLGSLEPGDAVNLERALPADGRLDGHFVQGHVDGVAEVTEIEQVGGGPASGASGTSSGEGGEPDGDWMFGFSLPDDLAPYVVEKGSIGVDGISLTVAELREGSFTTAIIPATYDLTTLSAKAVGDPVHLEVDVVAKYVESLTEGYR